MELEPFSGELNSEEALPERHMVEENEESEEVYVPASDWGNDEDSANEAS